MSQGQLLGGEPGGRVVGAPELEGAHALEVLALQVDLGADQRVQSAGAQHGGAMGDAGEPFGGEHGRRRG
ncbi:hypothetical protein SHIRM173S_04251 [Streptomyces hirsutus]